MVTEWRDEMTDCMGISGKFWQELYLNAARRMLTLVYAQIVERCANPEDCATFAPESYGWGEATCAVANTIITGFGWGTPGCSPKREDLYLEVLVHTNEFLCPEGGGPWVSTVFTIFDSDSRRDPLPENYGVLIRIDFMDGAFRIYGADAPRYKEIWSASVVEV